MIRFLKKIYQLYGNKLTKWVFPTILFFYPFVTVNQGVDVSDSMYSFSNFLYFTRMEGMWVVSTYVANVIGFLLTHLPFGTTLLGMRIYTTLLVSGTVLLVYYMLKKWMPAWIVFAGELIAIGFCWIPTGILYNYLSYFLLTLGAILLYQGLVEEKDKYLVLAGITLGINVFVRIPNVTETLLIIGVWYYLYKKNVKLNQILTKTACCLAGYIGGVILPLIAILSQYGMQGILSMVTGLSGIQNSDDTYSAWSMIASVIDAYKRTSKWAFLIMIGIALGMAMFSCLKGKYEKEKKLLYLIGMAILLRFLWGRGMFSFRYYEDYSSMYEWGMLGLFLSWIAVIGMLASGKNSLEEKLWAVINLSILLVTPLGSNNYTFQNLNNLFLVAPFTLYAFVKWYRRKEGKGMLTGLSYPWKAMVAMVGIMIFVQSAGFHSQFAFRDGMDGSIRNYKLSTPDSLAGMYTTQENGKAITSLAEYFSKAEQELKTGYLSNNKEKEVILYGDCPGISFMLQIPFAISTPWPDLDSVSYETFVEDIASLEENPIVILRNVETVGELSAAKKEYLLQFMQKNQYTNLYNNGTYGVYAPQTNE